MLFFMIMNFSLSMLFLFMKHPLSMGCLLLLQTMLISLIIGLLNITYWYSYILFLIMMGGMLVLFIYMTSIASNEKFKYSNKLLMMLMIFILMNFFYFIDQYYLNLNLMNTDIFNNFNYINNSMIMSKFINFPTNNIYMIIIFYLLITMIAIVKITETKMGPLRQTY